MDGDEEEEEPPPARRVDCDLMLIVGMFPVEDESPVLGLDLCLIGLVETCLAFMADRFCRFVASFSPGEKGFNLFGDPVEEEANPEAVMDESERNVCVYTRWCEYNMGGF